MRIARSVSPRRRKRQLDSFRIDLDHLDERLDRLVRLLVEEEIEALEIGARQLPRLRQELLDVDARRQPSQAEEQRESEQPPDLEVHPGLALRRRGAVGAGAQCALQPLDLAALPEKARHAGENPGRGPESEEQEKSEDHGHLPRLPEEETQLHCVGIHQREGEYHHEEHRPQQPRQVFDESHQSKTAAPCRRRRSSTAGPIPYF
jgi:hypothetical protein